MKKESNSMTWDMLGSSRRPDYIGAPQDDRNMLAITEGKG
jgi:hypothetical protein